MGDRVGMVLLVVWQGLEAVFGHRDEDGPNRARKRVTSAGKAIIYSVIGFSAVRVATGRLVLEEGQRHRLHDRQAHGLAGRAAHRGRGRPGHPRHRRRLLRAWTEKFAKHINAEGKSGDTGTAYLWFGKAGYAAKGIAFGIVGVAVPVRRGDPRPEEVGRPRPGPEQGARHQPFGPVLLAVIAFGIGCYGPSCFARARRVTDGPPHRCLPRRRRRRRPPPR